MKLTDIASNYQKLSAKSKTQFWQNTRMLEYLFLLGIVLNPPHRLLLDSNIVMRFKDFINGETKDSVLSVFLFFDYLKSSKLKAPLFITPTVSYEYYRQKNFGSLIEHWKSFSKLKDLIQTHSGSEVYFQGLGTFEQAAHSFNLIEKDVDLVKGDLGVFHIAMLATNFKYRE